MRNVTYSLCDEQALSAISFVRHLLTAAVARVNSGASQTLTARKSTETPPRDSRHLTDTRTRVSTLLEYSVAYEMNSILEEDGASYSISSVLWNIFPDLIVRDRNRDNLLGLEVKALHTAAEEKSANLDTPLYMIRSGRDFIVILIWGWASSEIGGAQITYPHIHAADVFDAWLLAKIRDYGWLLNQNGRIKGIDLCSPLIDAGPGRFKAEEGNLGKLMRISMPVGLDEDVPGHDAMRAENDRYARFRELAVALGLRETFLDICTIEGGTVIDVMRAESYPVSCTALGLAKRPDGSSLVLLAGRQVSKWLACAEGRSHGNGSTCLWLSQKLGWEVYRKHKNQWTRIDKGNKPDSQMDRIKTALNQVPE